MPIQLTWQPNANPAVANLINLGLEISGDDAALAAVTDGRVRLVEVAAPAARSSTAGPSESTAERLIATFHGKFHRDASVAQASRITFEIFIGRSTIPAHSQNAQGFDPECIFGVDAFVFTFVNREFVVWFPFHIDTRSEGRFLEIQAIADIDVTGGTTRELGRSMVLNLGIRRTHAVDTTSNLPSGAALSYTGDLIGNVILSHDAYLLHGGLRNAAQSTPTEIVVDPAVIPVPPAGTQVRFQPYVANSMHIVLMIDLLDGLSPPDSFLTSAITGVTNAAPLRTGTIARVKAAIPTALRDIFVDAGFTGADVRWSDDTAASALVTAFTGAFVRQSLGGNFWRLRATGTPLVTAFWNFFVGSSDQIQSAGTGEQLEMQNAPTAIGTRQVFMQNAVPIGSGDKRVTKPMDIAVAVFQDLLMTRSGIARRYASLAAYNDAVDRVAGKMLILIAHEVGHSLGLMHHCKVENSGNYSENNGSPVLSLMSAGVESGGFGVGMHFHPQAKVIWAAAFGVTPNFTDTFLRNKNWTRAEVFTLDWTDRTTRFIRAHGEESIARPGLGAGFTSTPPFASATSPQRGTFVPPSTTP